MTSTAIVKARSAAVHQGRTCRPHAGRAQDRAFRRRGHREQHGHHPVLVAGCVAPDDDHGLQQPADPEQHHRAGEGELGLPGRVPAGGARRHRPLPGARLPIAAWVSSALLPTCSLARIRST